MPRDIQPMELTCAGQGVWLTMCSLVQKWPVTAVTAVAHALSPLLASATPDALPCAAAAPRVTPGALSAAPTVVTAPAAIAAGQEMSMRRRRLCTMSDARARHVQRQVENGGKGAPMVDVTADPAAAATLVPTSAALVTIRAAGFTTVSLVLYGVRQSCSVRHVSGVALAHDSPACTHACDGDAVTVQIPFSRIGEGREISTYAAAMDVTVLPALSAICKHVALVLARASAVPTALNTSRATTAAAVRSKKSPPRRPAAPAAMLPTKLEARAPACPPPVGPAPPNTTVPEAAAAPRTTCSKSEYARSLCCGVSPPQWGTPPGVWLCA